jgi:hypothetical protein
MKFGQGLRLLEPDQKPDRSLPEGPHKGYMEHPHVSAKYNM